MQIHIIAIGQRLDSWVTQGYEEYVKRLPHECRVNLIEIASKKRGKNSDTHRIIREEGERLIAAIPLRSHVITLDAGGEQWSTTQLAGQLQQWLADGRDIALLVGGPDGLSDQCHSVAESSWSLSNLTYPHPMVRVIVAEQIYRAWSILKGHPYHR